MPAAASENNDNNSIHNDHHCPFDEEYYHLCQRGPDNNTPTASNTHRGLHPVFLRRGGRGSGCRGDFDLGGLHVPSHPKKKKKHFQMIPAIPFKI